MPGGFRRNSAGNRRNYCRHSTGIPLEFRTFPAGIPPDYCRHSASIQMEFQPEFHRNYCRHSAGIPLEFQPEFRRNYCRHSAGIPLEFQPEFCRNYCRHSTGIPLELLLAYRWYSGQLQLEFHWNSWPEYCWNSRIRIEFWLGKNYCQHIARILDFFTQHWFRIHTYKLNIHAYKLYLYTVSSHSNQILCWLPSIELGTPVSVKYQQTKWYKTWTADYWLGIKHRHTNT